MIYEISMPHISYSLSMLKATSYHVSASVCSSSQPISKDHVLCSRKHESITSLTFPASSVWGLSMGVHKLGVEYCSGWL